MTNQTYQAIETAVTNRIPLWYDNSEIIKELNTAIKNGWINRPSHTQVEWTEKGVNEAKELENRAIIDLNGKRIEITDLDKAIEEADTFQHFAHVNPEFKELDAKRQAYWNDLHSKLISRKEAANESI